MGSTFSNGTQGELIATLTQLGETAAACYETTTHTLHGNVLWSVVRVTAKQRGAFGLDAGQSTTVIVCHLLQRSGAMWGSQSMEESMHPYYYSCPLSYLDLAPERSRKWRDGVRAFHARRCAPLAPSPLEPD